MFCGIKAAGGHKIKNKITRQIPVFMGFAELALGGTTFELCHAS